MGTWSGTYNGTVVNFGDVSGTWGSVIISQNNNQISGTFTLGGPDVNPQCTNGTFSGNINNTSVTFTVVFNAGCDTLTWIGTVNSAGDSFSGTWTGTNQSGNNTSSGTFTGTKTGGGGGECADLSGNWTITDHCEPWEIGGQSVITQQSCTANYYSDPPYTTRSGYFSVAQTTADFYNTKYQPALHAACNIPSANEVRCVYDDDECYFTIRKTQ